jgi:tRNA-Thr(GGU) m(6)t(6)A37 methyltransferase TsaA
VLELDGFSHVWVIFVFHLNTVSKNNRVPSKIAPPALGGKKVGVLATRSPHRANPIGMTLCKLDSITRPTKGSLKTTLNVSGLDLVDGTPILDIKPYVPNYDSVPSDQVHLPPWVSGGLATRRPVHIQPKALEELQVILSEQPNALDFYGTHCGDGSMDETMKSISHCIAEVLSIDVRSAWQTNKARDSKFQAERAGRIRDVLSENSAPDSAPANDSEQCTQQLDNLLIYYTVQAPEQHARNTSEGSGAEDIVHVNSIQLLTCENSTSNRVGEVRGAIVAASPVTVYEDEQLKEGIAIEAASSVIVDVEEQPKETVAIDAASAIDVGADEPSKETIAISAAFSVTVEGDEQSEKTVETDVSPTNELPTDADYKSLKSYWGKAAARNTPTGLVPEERGPQSTEKFFVFSAKPVASARPAAAKTGAQVHAITDDEMASVDLLSNDETKMAPRGVKSGAPVHPDDVNEMPTVVPLLPAAESSDQKSAVGGDETGAPTVVLPRPIVPVENSEQGSTFGNE